MKKFTALLVLAGLAQYAGAADVQGNAKAAGAKVEMCIGCHGIPGYKASFPEVYRVPMIGGQSEKYIIAALNEYKKGDRKHPSMRGIAASLSDQDIADVAAYYAQMPAK
jgi:cytochrome c553